MSNTPIAVSTSNVQIFASMHHFQEREKKFPEVMADSRARKGQDKSRISYCTKTTECSNSDKSKGHRSQAEGLSH